MQQLEKSSLPIALLRPLVAGSMGQRKLSFRNADYAVDVASPLSFKGCDLVFFLYPPETAVKLCPIAVKTGAICIDGSGAYSLSSLYRFLVPEVNGRVITAEERVFVSPEPAAVCLAHLLYPIHKRIGLSEIEIVYLQGVTGEENEKAMLYQYQEYLSTSLSSPPKLTLAPVFNIIPSIGQQKGKGETAVERQIHLQLERLFAFPQLSVRVMALQTPILSASCFCITIRGRSNLSLEQLQEILASVPDVRIMDEPSRAVWPTPRTAAQSKTFEVGRLRSYPENNMVQFFVAVDEIEKGFAANVLSITDLLIQSAEPTLL